MKKISLLMMMLFIVGSSSLFAQGKQPGDKQGNKEEKEAKMIGFLTEKLALTPEEAEKFWPVYKQMKEELKANRKAFKEDKPDKDVKIDDMTDAEVKALLDNGFAMKEKDLEIKKKYNEEFIKIIGVKRTAKLYHLEHEFMKGNNGAGGPHQGPPPGP